MAVGLVLKKGDLYCKYCKLSEILFANKKKEKEKHQAQTKTQKDNRLTNRHTHARAHTLEHLSLLVICHKSAYRFRQRNLR